MDFIDGLPISQGKTTILVVVDRLSKMAHFMAIKHPYTAQTVAQVFFNNVFKLHGLPKSIVCDRDAVFTSDFWRELFNLHGTIFNMSSAYHPQTDGQTKAVNRVLEMYLRCFTGERPSKWTQWLSWAEYCYNTSPHSTTRVSPFEAVYGRPPPTILTYVRGTAKNGDVARELKSRDVVLKDLKRHILAAQSRMKLNADKKRRELELQDGDEVYLKLQPYKQATIRMGKQTKLSPKYYGPFKVQEKVGSVSYRLVLPTTSKIHPVFHVSQLKPKLKQNQVIQPHLPEMHKDEDGSFIIQPQDILEERTKHNKEQVLVQWKGLKPKDATWEPKAAMLQQFPDFFRLRTSGIQGEGSVTVLFSLALEEELEHGQHLDTFGQHSSKKIQIQTHDSNSNNLEPKGREAGHMSPTAIHMSLLLASQETSLSNSNKRSLAIQPPDSNSNSNSNSKEKLKMKTYPNSS